MAKLVICFIFIIFFTKNYLNATKLNYPRVLLPIFEKVSIDFTLEVIEKGCFKWTSSRQDLILITPLYKDAEMECSYQATITVLTRERQRSTVIVLAEDLATGESLRCDIILDVIHKLGVTTTTRQLYLEEAPETFVLRAEDSQGNAFTTLDGIEFNWTIEALNSRNDVTPALRFLTFTESSFHEVPTALENFENQGLKGYKVLLEGINTGTAKVTVSMPYPEYSNVPIIETYISVLANIILEPSDVFMLTGDTIQFRIYQLKMGKLTEITLNNQYYLEVIDDTIAKIWGTSVTGHKLGRTVIVLRDRNMPSDQNFMDEAQLYAESSVPSARLTVVEPKILKLHLLPYNNWLTVEGEKHTVAVDLYTRDNQKITLGSGYVIRTELDEYHFEVHKRSANGSRLYGEALREGTTAVYGSFKDLSAQSEMQIFRELSIVPNKVFLPYDPTQIRKTQQIQFTAYGGDGSYVWNTLQPSLLKINSQGLASTTVALKNNDSKRIMDICETFNNKTLCTAHVRVGLTKNLKIFRQADVYFLPPIELKILKYNFETALNDYVHIHVGIYTKVNDILMPLTYCENLLLDHEFTSYTTQSHSQQLLSQQIFQIDYNYNYNKKADSSEAETKMVEGSCQILHLHSKAVGFTHLKLSYKYRDHILKDEVTLYVFEPLKISDPIENEVILPIGSSRNIIYTNGPERIYTLEAELTKDVFFDNETATIKELQFDSVKSFHAFNVMCTKIGSMNFSFGIFNALSTSNCVPYISKIETKIDCVKPRFLNLYANEPIRNTCPMEMKKTLLQLNERDEKFHIEIEVQDIKNRKLMNTSSLVISWEFAAGSQPYRPGVITHYIKRAVRFFDGVVPLPVKDILIIKVNEAVEQNFRAKGTVIGYHEKSLTRENISPEVPLFCLENPKTGEMYTPIIENEISFRTVNSTIFMSDHVSIYMDKRRKEHIPLLQGSGFYDYDLSEEGIVEIDLQTSKMELIVMPLRTGQTRLALRDLCLMNEPAYLSISVVSIGFIRVQSLDRVERTKSIEAIVRLYDNYEKPLNVDLFNLYIYDLQEEVFNPHVLNVRLGDQLNLNTGEVRYILHGNNLGETKIVFSAGKGDFTVYSDPLTVQVFLPLKLYPRNSTLIVNSTVQISHHGGPQPDNNIIYVVHDKRVISIESAIVTALKLGKTKVTGKCVIINPGNNEDILTVSEDTIEFEVVSLTSIQIETPLTKIRSGAIMPATIWGMPDLSPLILGTLNDMHITWFTNQPDVVSIYNVFAEAGIEYEESDLISVRIKALSPGKAKIIASVQLPGGRKLLDSLEIVVFKILALESPKHMTTDSILMPPSSSVQLQVNLDEAVYHVASTSNNIVSVEYDGFVHSREMLGRDTIIANTFDQSLAIGVEVKDIQYIMASLSYPTMQLKQTEQKIPSGTNFALKVSLHDNLGNEFAHVVGDGMGLKYELSHKDTVDVHTGKNLTIALNMPRRTNNMIAISLKDTIGVKHAEDYIKLSVADSLQAYPIKTIFSVGDIICFESALSTASLSPPSLPFLPLYWSSSDEGILTIDKQTGIAQVVGNRYKLGDTVAVIAGDKVSGNFIKYDVEVRDADVIRFNKTFDIFTGNMYRGYFIMHHRLQVNKLTNLYAKNVTKCMQLLEGHQFTQNFFKCQLSSKQELGQQLLEYYMVSPIFDADAGGLYACEITSKLHFNETLLLMKTDDVGFELKVSFKSHDLSDVLSLKLVPGIKVTPSILMLSNSQEQDFTITGIDKVLQKVEVNTSDDSVLQVILTIKGHGFLKFKIRILKELSTYEQPLYVHVYSPNTLEEIKIPLIDNDDRMDKCGQQPFGMVVRMIQTGLSYLGVAVVTIVLGGLVIWGFSTWNPSVGAYHINDEVFARGQNSFDARMSDIPTKYLDDSQQFYPSYEQQYYYESQSSPNSSFGNEHLFYGDGTMLPTETRRHHSRYV